ncbi:MAG: DMT family transporter [Bacteroidetes bacterium]|nr:DMT family transporter [Bacteroidota bacterium]
MKQGVLKSDLLLLLASLIWGLAFVAQRAGMEYVGPFIFNGIRFAFGAVVLIPFFSIKSNNRKDHSSKPVIFDKYLLKGGILAGLVLFVGASFQQAGLVYTTAGNAGFITSLYVIFVPVFGLIWKQYPARGTWVGALMAALGMYLLSVSGGFTLLFGDLLVLISAFFWAAHVLIIGKLSPGNNPVKLAFVQFLICSILSLAAAFIFESNTLTGIYQAAVPILYGGLLSVGIAYTLQIIAQKKVPPAHAAIILSLEAVFAALGGWIILNEVMFFRGLAGCALMLGGVIVSQFYKPGKGKPSNKYKFE